MVRSLPIAGVSQTAVRHYPSLMRHFGESHLYQPAGC
jgi:hypothetical protein